MNDNKPKAMGPNPDRPGQNGASFTPRATNAEIEEYVHRCVDLLAKNKSEIQIMEQLSKELDRSEAQVKRYIRKAYKLIRESFEIDLPGAVSRMELGLRGDLRTAYTEYNNASDERSRQIWYKLILETKDRLIKFLPETKAEEAGSFINVSYREVTDKPVEESVLLESGDKPEEDNS